MKRENGGCLPRGKSNVGCQRIIASNKWGKKFHNFAGGLVLFFAYFCMHTVQLLYTQTSIMQLAYCQGCWKVRFRELGPEPYGLWNLRLAEVILSYFTAQLKDLKKIEIEIMGRGDGGMA